MKRWRAFLLGVVAICAAGCVRTGGDRDVIYHVSTIHALIEGIFKGEVTFGELKRHGTIGLGAIDEVDGELVLLDGTCYQVRADGKVLKVKDTQQTPYAIVTKFVPDRVLDVNEEMDFDRLRRTLDQQLGNLNLPYAFRIEGTFSYVKTRSVPRQSPPYPRLIEVIKNQPEFEFKDVDGVIVGFRLPPYLDGLAVPGYHFHFLTSDLKGGGHLLAFRARRLHVGTDRSAAVHVVLPQSEAFSKVDLTKRNQDELDQIMGRTRAK
jgi:acetolactate decarboxylase